MGGLSEDDIEALKKLVPLADEIRRDAEYQKSRSIMWSYWKTVVISAAGVIVALFLIWEKVKLFGTWVFR